MGRQVSFRITVDDLAAIAEWLRDHDGVVLVQPMPTQDLVICPTLEAVRGSWPLGSISQHFFARREDTAAVLTHHVPRQDQWLVSSTRSPVIEFSLMEDTPSRGRVAGGRFYFSTTFLETSTTLIKHSTDFIKWADSLLGWVRRNWTKSGDGVYLSPSAAKV